MPTVVAVVPVHNGAGHIGRALDSILRQQYPGLRILVMDDCSSDGTSSVLQGYASRLEVVRNRENLGFSGNLNAALSRASDADLLFIHQDDVELMDEDYVARATSHFADPSVAAVCGQGVDFQRLSFAKRVMSRLLNNDARDNEVTNISYSLLKADLFRASALREIGGFGYAVTRKLGIEDQILGQGLRRAGYRLVKDPSLAYRLDYARTESLWSFLAKEADAGRNLGYALSAGLITSNPSQSRETRTKRNYRLSQVVIFGLLGMAAVSVAFFPLPGAAAVGGLLLLRLLVHLGRSRGFLWREKPAFAAIALFHDLFFAAGWYVGVGEGLAKRLVSLRAGAAVATRPEEETDSASH